MTSDGGFVLYGSVCDICFERHRVATVGEAPLEPFERGMTFVDAVAVMAVIGAAMFAVLYVIWQWVYGG